MLTEIRQLSSGVQLIKAFKHFFHVVCLLCCTSVDESLECDHLNESY